MGECGILHRVLQSIYESANRATNDLKQLQFVLSVFDNAH